MDKRERIAEVLDKLKELLPPAMKCLVMGFCPNFRHLLDGVTDEEIEHYMTIIDQYLNYIKTGDGVNE